MGRSCRWVIGMRKSGKSREEVALSLMRDSGPMASCKEVIALDQEEMEHIIWFIPIYDNGWEYGYQSLRTTSKDLFECAQQALECVAYGERVGVRMLRIDGELFDELF